MKKKWVIGLIAGSVAILAVIIGVFAYQCWLEDNIVFTDSDKITVQYGDKFDLSGVNIIKKGYLNNKKDDIDVSYNGKVDEKSLGKYDVDVIVHKGKKKKTKKYVVEVVDTVAPVIELSGDREITVEAGDEYDEPGYTATDNCDDDVTDNVIVDGKVDTSVLGDYTISYSVKDSSGNEATAARIVHVTDTTSPEITFDGGDVYYMAKGTDYSEPGYTATDNYDGDISDKVQVSGTVDTNTSGKYTLTYTVKDSAGNQAEASRTVRVYSPMSVDTVNPGSKVVYLTFDDGPGPYTAQLLDILDKYNVKATFFVTNTHPDYQNLIAQEAQRGHTIAIHSASHDYARIYQNVDAYFQDFDEMNNIIIAQTGKSADIVRFPGGSSNTISARYCSGIMSQLVYEVEDRGFQYCDWNVSSGDAGGTTSTGEVFCNVTEGISRNNISIVLQHDIKDFSVNAVEQIIQWGLSEGYTFLPITAQTPMSHHGVNN